MPSPPPTIEQLQQEVETLKKQISIRPQAGAQLAQSELTVEPWDHTGPNLPSQLAGWWDMNQDQRCIAVATFYENSDLSQSEIGQMVGLSNSRIAHMCARGKREMRFPQPVTTANATGHTFVDMGQYQQADPFPQFVSPPEQPLASGFKAELFEELFAKFCGEVGRPELMPGCEYAGHLESEEEDIILISDLHAPCHDENALNLLLTKEKGRGQTCLIGGDLCTFDSVTRHRRFTSPFSGKEEVIRTQVVISAIANHFDRVVVLPGNHDKRWIKMLAELLGPDMLDTMRALDPMSSILDPLRFFTGGHDNVLIAPPLVHQDARYDFLYQHGDMIVGHSEKYSIIGVKAVSEFNRWLLSNRKTLGINDWRVVANGHTHQQGIITSDDMVQLIESGCMCRQADYTSDPQCRTPRPWVPGWTKILQINGRTDLSYTRFIHAAKF